MLDSIQNFAPFQRHTKVKITRPENTIAAFRRIDARFMRCCIACRSRIRRFQFFKFLFHGRIRLSIQSSPFDVIVRDFTFVDRVTKIRLAIQSAFTTVTIWSVQSKFSIFVRKTPDEPWKCELMSMKEVPNKLKQTMSDAFVRTGSIIRNRTTSSSGSIRFNVLDHFCPSNNENLLEQNQIKSRRIKMHSDKLPKCDECRRTCVGPMTSCSKISQSILFKLYIARRSSSLVVDFVYLSFAGAVSCVLTIIKSAAYSRHSGNKISARFSCISSRILAASRAVGV